MQISFLIPGDPKPQGSKDQFGRESCKTLPAWRNLISLAAKMEMSGNNFQLFEGPVMVEIEFGFSRPGLHFGTGKNSKILKTSAPTYKISTPDIDKLTRAVLDSLTGIVFRDDAQVAKIAAVKKYDSFPGAVITVTQLSPMERF